MRENARLQVRSFDVFDTVLTRRVGDPEVAIALLAHRVAPYDGPAGAFAAARLRCERDLTRRLGRHATLLEIHRAVAGALNEPVARAADWVRVEEDLERELSVALPGAVDRLERARKEADRVVFVSDTPHRAAFLRELLERAGLATPEDRVFTSSSGAHSKSRGGLFHAVAEELHEELGDADFVHVGDNRHGDVATARLEGWQGVWAPEGKLDRYERLLEQHAAETDHLTSWLAGASRLARLEARAAGVAKPIAEVSAGAFAPMLVGYALWVIGQARARGTKRLYYVARDGAVMLEAARHVVGALAPDLELRYLHGSRQPWIFGAGATSDVILSRWVTPRRDFTPRTALARVHLTPEEAHALTGHPLTDPARQHAALGAEEREEIARLMQQDPLLGRVREQADVVAQQTLAYLEQEGFFDGVPSALVDAGWEGRTAAAFDHLVRRGGGEKVDHFVIGMLPSTADPRQEDGVRMTPWLFDQQRSPGSGLGDGRLFQAPNLLVEMLCAGTEGRTIGYEQVDGRMRPVLAASSNDPVLAWGLPQMQSVAVRVAELAAPHLAASAVHVDCRPAVAEGLRAFWTDPTREEALAWGAFPWEEEIWPPYSPVAQRLTTRDVLQRLRRGDRRIRRTNSWRAGSAEVSGQPWKAMLRLKAWQDEHGETLRKVPRRLRLEVAKRRC